MLHDVDQAFSRRCAVQMDAWIEARALHREPALGYERRMSVHCFVAPLVEPTHAFGAASEGAP